MKILKTVVTLTILVISTSTNAALVGRLASTEGGTDYQAYYDTEAGITWLADANYAQTSGVDFDGRMELSGREPENNYYLFMDSLNISGVTDWRLPSNYGLYVDPTCSGHPSSSSGYNCSGSELGNMFYNVLGGVEGQSISTTHNSNYDLFTNVRDGSYWYDPSNGYGYFDFNNGSQYNADGGDYELYLWAVYDGDVGASVVPVPAAAWLFGSGVIGLIGLARKNRNRLSCN